MWLFLIPAGGSAAISGLAVADGNAGSDFFGGGLSNVGDLTLRGVWVRDNHAGEGGGLRNDGRMTITDCTVRGNTAAGSHST